MKKKYVILFILLIIYIIVSIFFKKNNIIQRYDEIRRAIYGEPIDASGTINNKYFGINSNGNITSNTNGLNKAIAYANTNNIEYIKLEKGEYLINSVIYMKSNICFDLNGATIRYDTNGDITYGIFRILNESNIKIINGTLIGDKDTHDYDTIKSSHEWGMGISIRSSNNIEIDNLQIKKMTGDGIYIAQDESVKKEKCSENIKITNCSIFENRRQGISIICGRNIEIYNNEIHTIDGTAPKAGIDCEPNYIYEIADNIKIYKNKIYNKNNISIILAKNSINVEICENELEGRLSILEAREKVQIRDNIMKNGDLQCSTTLVDIDNGHIIKLLQIENNKFYNVNLKFTYNNNLVLKDNEILEGVVILKSTNGEIYNNIINNKNRKEYAYNFDILDKEGLDEKYVIYIYNNEEIGQYTYTYKYISQYIELYKEKKQD